MDECRQLRHGRYERRRVHEPQRPGRDDLRRWRGDFRRRELYLQWWRKHGFDLPLGRGSEQRQRRRPWLYAAGRLSLQPERHLRLRPPALRRHGLELHRPPLPRRRQWRRRLRLRRPFEGLRNLRQCRALQQQHDLLWRRRVPSWRNSRFMCHYEQLGRQLGQRRLYSRRDAPRFVTRRQPRPLFRCKNAQHDWWERRRSLPAGGRVPCRELHHPRQRARPQVGRGRLRQPQQRDPAQLPCLWQHRAERNRRSPAGKRSRRELHDLRQRRRYQRHDRHGTPPDRRHRRQLHRLRQSNIGRRVGCRQDFRDVREQPRLESA